ncbi:MAG: LON peptidase substrate-binding domain-containing protein [Rubrivivax sp.]|nr:LON peptidase substrate-binding domain-containing protein [Rubrivivax sp.]
MAVAERIDALPLFPLQSVLFPGGQLALKIFETRYLDLVADCLRRQRPFGVVCLLQGGEVRSGPGAVRFEGSGVLARLDEVDGEQPGLLHARCSGTQRFRLDGPATQQADGLWLGDAELLPDDTVTVPQAQFLPTVRALANAIATLKSQGTEPFPLPHRLDDAGWVANRWCEILPIPLAAKQKLMELDDPQVRLQLVHEYLRGKGVVGA